MTSAERAALRRRRAQRASRRAVLTIVIGGVMLALPFAVLGGLVLTVFKPSGTSLAQAVLLTVFAGLFVFSFLELLIRLGVRSINSEREEAFDFWSKPRYDTYTAARQYIYRNASKHEREQRWYGGEQA